MEAAPDLLQHNRRAWNRGAVSDGRWSTPVSPGEVAQARAGNWTVILTPRLPVPRDWLGDVRGRDVLCLASGGGQQAPLLAAAGATVTSYDLSEGQLARDRLVAEREGLQIRCIQGDMADLAALAGEAFDLIFHPAANVFAPDPRPVWRECHRVLRPGGSLLAGFVNPDVYLFDNTEADRTGELVVRYSLPYSDMKDLSPAALAERIAREEPLEFSHSMDIQLGGQLAAGFLISGFYEDRWFDDSWVLSRHCPVAFATRALKPR